jgi:hypothetical protein
MTDIFKTTRFFLLLIPISIISFQTLSQTNTIQAQSSSNNEFYQL